MRLPHWLQLPVFEDRETTCQARLLVRLLRVMALVALVGLITALIDPRNALTVTVVFYGLLYGWLGVVMAVTRSGRVVVAAWVFTLFFWGVIAFVTLGFGGLQGQYASVFAVCTLLVGSVVGGRAAIGVAIASSLWSAMVMYLEERGALPFHFGPYTPANAWASVTVTVVMTSVLLNESLTSLRAVHAEAQRASEARDEALRRSFQGQKMELVGSLTSGIAHDFNNLLTVIVGSLDALRAGTPPDDKDARDLIDDLSLAASRSTLMTAQLLALGRPKSSAGEPIDLGALVEHSAKMLPRLLGSLIDVKTQVEAGQWVFASRTACDQIILNLAVNARDAMPRGGTLAIAVRRAGERVCLAVRDSGAGMSREIQARIFEPFFTTKSTGTGLGLATVQQLTAQYGGQITLESELGRGTTFELQFPRIEAPEGATLSLPPSEEADRARPPAGQRVLLVEDDPLVRRAVSRMLTAEGYEVTAAHDGEEAIALLGAMAAPPACVVTDISMRRMDGDVLATRLARSHPSLPVVIISGNRELQPSTLDGPRTFIAKPVDQAQLRTAMATLLGRADRS